MTDWRDEVIRGEARPGYMGAINTLYMSEVPVIEAPNSLPDGKTVFYTDIPGMGERIFVREIDDLLWKLYIADQRALAREHLQRCVSRAEIDLGLVVA